jgi:hypothetical protein
MSQTDKRKLCWRFFTLIVFSGVLYLLTSEPQVIKADTFGNCVACDTNLNSCYNACHQHEIQMQQQLGDPNWTDPPEVVASWVGKLPGDKEADVLAKM